VVDLRTLLQDGTKVRAVAGSRSLHRRKTLDGGMAALDCRLDRLIEAGDHVLALLAVDDVLPGNATAAPLLRLRGRYVDDTGRPAARP
jgi:hypothetical protein